MTILQIETTLAVLGDRRRYSIDTSISIAIQRIPLTTSNLCRPPIQSDALTDTLSRWRFAPMALSVLVGIGCSAFLPVLIYLILRDPTARNDFWSGNWPDDFLSVVAFAVGYFVAGNCCLVAARAYLRGRYRAGVVLNLAFVVVFILCIVFG